MAAPRGHKLQHPWTALSTVGAGARLSLIESALSKIGVQPRISTTLRRTPHMLAQRQFTFVVIDFPGQQAAALALARLTRELQGRFCAIILIADIASPDLFAEAQTAGLDACLSASFTSERLARLLMLLAPKSSIRAAEFRNVQNQYQDDKSAKRHQTHELLPSRSCSPITCVVAKSERTNAAPRSRHARPPGAQALALHAIFVNREKCPDHLHHRHNPAHAGGAKKTTRREGSARLRLKI